MISVLALLSCFLIENDNRDLFPIATNHNSFNHLVEREQELNDEVFEEDAVAIRAQAGYEWNKFLNNNLRYPQEAREKGIMGKVFVKFIVEKDGSLTHHEIIVEKSELRGGLKEEALRVFTICPKWLPAKDGNGNIIRSYKTMPISFKMM